MRIAFMLVFMALLADTYHRMAHAQGKKEPDPHTRPGILDPERQEKLLRSADPLARELREANRLYSSRKTEEALEAYRTLAHKNRTSELPAVQACLSYLTLMQGILHYEAGRHAEARNTLEEVIKIAPTGEDATLACYYMALAWRDEPNEVQAYNWFEQLAASTNNPDKKVPAQFVDDAYFFMKRYLERHRRDQPVLHEKWLALMHLLSTKNPASSEYSELLRYYRNLSDWDNYRKVVNYKMTPEEAEFETLNLMLNTLADRYLDLKKSQPEKSQAFRKELDAFLNIELPRRLDALKLKSEKSYQDLYFLTLKAHGIYGNPETAGKMILTWLQANPRDKSALHQYGGYALDGEVHLPSLLEAFKEYLSQNEDRDNTLELFIHICRRKKLDRKLAESVMLAAKASDWWVAEFWREFDDARAFAAYEKVIGSGSTSDALRKEASWHAAEFLLKEKRHEEAMALFRTIEKPEAKYKEGECLAGMKQWENALRLWAALKEQLDRRSGLHFTLDYRTAELLLEHGQTERGAELAGRLFRTYTRGQPATMVNELFEKYDLEKPKR